MTFEAIAATGVRTHIEVDAERQAHWYVMVSHSGRAGMGRNDVSLGREN
jgi:xanthine/uracil permease